MCSFLQAREKTKEDFLEEVIFEQGLMPVEIQGEYSQECQQLEGSQQGTEPCLGWLLGNHLSGISVSRETQFRLLQRRRGSQCWEDFYGYSGAVARSATPAQRCPLSAGTLAAGLGTGLKKQAPCPRVFLERRAKN